MSGSLEVWWPKCGVCVLHANGHRIIFCPRARTVCASRAVRQYFAIMDRLPRGRKRRVDESWPPNIEQEKLTTRVSLLQSIQFCTGVRSHWVRRSHGFVSLSLPSSCSGMSGAAIYLGGEVPQEVYRNSPYIRNTAIPRDIPEVRIIR